MSPEAVNSVIYLVLTAWGRPLTHVLRVILPIPSTNILSPSHWAAKGARVQVFVTLDISKMILYSNVHNVTSLVKPASPQGLSLIVPPVMFLLPLLQCFKNRLKILKSENVKKNVPFRDTTNHRLIKSAEYVTRLAMSATERVFRVVYLVSRVDFWIPFLQHVRLPALLPMGITRQVRRIIYAKYVHKIANSATVRRQTIVLSVMKIFLFIMISWT